MVSKELFKELELIWVEEFDIELEPEQVDELGNTLVNYHELLLQIDQREKSVEQ